MEGQVWNLLGLPSCGRVYCDAEAEVGVGGDGEEIWEREMGIVVWTGGE
jgi:hypothetical protein